MRIYLAHPIRGINPNPTPAYLAENQRKAKEMADRIRALGVTVYCPAEHEEFIQPAYDAGFLTVEQILTIDCEIINRCDAVVFYNHEDVFSSGMKIEWCHVVATRKPMCVISTIGWEPHDFIRSVEDSKDVQ